MGRDLDKRWAASSTFPSEFQSMNHHKPTLLTTFDYKYFIEKFFCTIEYTFLGIRDMILLRAHIRGLGFKAPLQSLHYAPFARFLTLPHCYCVCLKREKPVMHLAYNQRSNQSYFRKPRIPEWNIFKYFLFLK